MDVTNDGIIVSCFDRNSSYYGPSTSRDDVHGICRQNKEYIESKENDY